MHVQIEDLSTVQKQLNFRVDALRVDTALTEAYKNLGKDVRMKGFRKGKVPRRMLEQRFGKHIRSEVGGQLISEAFDEAVKEHELKPVSQPVVEPGDLKGGVDYEFSVTVEIRPEVVAQNWEGMDVEWPAIDIPEDEVQKELGQVAQRHATIEVVDDKDHTAVGGDFVMANAGLAAEGRDDWSIESLMVLVGQPMGLPAADFLSDHVVGMKTGSKKDVDITVPDGVAEGWDGLEAKPSVEVTEIKAQKAPALDDELAQDEGHDSLDALKADITFKLQEHLSHHAREAASEFALKKLIEMNEFDVPEGLIKSEARAILQQSVQQMARSGMRPPRITIEDLPEEQQDELNEQAGFSVRRSLLLESIARQAEVEVTDADVDGRIGELAEQMGQQPSALKGLLLKNDGIDDFRGRLLEEKALDVLLERANVVEVESIGHGGAHDHEHDHEGDEPEPEADEQDHAEDEADSASEANDESAGQEPPAAE